MGLLEGLGMGFIPPLGGTEKYIHDSLTPKYVNPSSCMPDSHRTLPETCALVLSVCVPTHEAHPKFDSKFREMNPLRYSTDTKRYTM